MLHPSPLLCTSLSHAGHCVSLTLYPEGALDTLKIPLYTVGPATSRSLTTLRNAHLPSAGIYGADTGNGENLARFILEHYKTVHNNNDRDNERQPLPALLFLVGEQRRDVIPRTLSAPELPAEERIRVDELVVYETGVMASFAADFAAALEATEGSEAVWVVVFSPTGCEAMLRHLGFVDEEGKRRVVERDSNMRRVYVATIGPTTRDYLIDEFGFEPDVCADKPSPEGIGESITRFMKDRGQL